MKAKPCASLLGIDGIGDQGIRRRSAYTFPNRSIKRLSSTSGQVVEMYGTILSSADAKYPASA
jgi:hypothetical protein